MRVRFYIEKRLGRDGKLMTRKRPIFMTVAFNGKRAIISTKKNVDLQWWSPEKQRVREEYSEALNINRWLDELENAAGVAWKALASLSEKPGVSDFRSEFEKFRPRFSEGFFDVMLLFMEEGSDRWTRASYQKVRTVFNQLRTFESEEDFRLDFSSMNDEFLERFVLFLTNKGLKDYTIRKTVNVIVWFLNWSTDQGYNVYRTYRNFYKKLPVLVASSSHKPVFLQWEELMTMANFITVETRMERARDIFLLSCFTGLKYSELILLTKNDVTDEEIIIRQKSGKERIVPLNRFSKQVIQKYRNRYYRANKALPLMSLVTYNKYLARLGLECQFERKVEHPRKPGTEVCLYEVMSSGISVNSFIMNALRLEIPAEIISSYTGVNSDKRVKKIKHELAKMEMKKFDAL